MSQLYSVLRRPLVTEKTTLMKENQRTLAFQVQSKANKSQIKEAVESIFKVKVESVRTANCHGKSKRMGRYEGKRPDWKKAYVTLKEGEKMVEFFESST